MKRHGINPLFLISGAASLLIAAQLAIILVRGEAACLNQGCKVVEQLTTVSPLLFNLGGLLYFQLLCWLFFAAGKRENNAAAAGRLLLLIGLAAEGVLLSYQLYVAKTLCSYCLTIFALLLLLNILAGWRQMLTATATLAAVVLASSMLSFGPAVLLSKGETINNGTYGVRGCSAPKKELYLFFSANCPHCQKVLSALESCSSCDFHFNPIDFLDDTLLGDSVERTASYDPQLNRLLLKLLGIETIPVLMEKTASGFSLIRGEQEIIRYVQRSCYQDEPVLYLGTTPQPQSGGLSILQPEGECSMNVECEESK